MRRREFFSLLATAAMAQQQRPSGKPDWPQWHGPNRDNLSPETGLLKEWPSSGPKLLWSARNLGEGYGSLAIAGDQIYLQGTRQNQSVVWALNRADGKLLGQAVIGSTEDNDRGGGPRGTPCVDSGVVYALTEAGDLGCVDRNSAQVRWKRNILRDFEGSNPSWNLSESPLIDGQKLIVSPGGRKGVMVALDKTTGKEIWACRDAAIAAGYSSAIPADIGGVRTYINFMDDAGIGVRASDGKLLWKYDRASNGTANAATPVFHDNKVFFTSGYSTGCGLVGLTPQGTGVRAQEIYFNREMQNHHGGVLLHGGHIYGSSNAILTCMEFATGKATWKNRSVGKSSLTYADGSLYLFSENNVVGLADASPQGYREKGRFEVEDQGRPSWAHPVVCGGRLYIRNQGVVSCYDVRA